MELFGLSNIRETGLRLASAVLARLVSNWPDRQEKLLEALGMITRESITRYSHPRRAQHVLRCQKPKKDESLAN